MKGRVDKDMKSRKRAFTFIDRITPLLILVIGMCFGWGLGALSFGNKPPKTWYIVTTLCGLLFVILCMTFNIIVDSVNFVFKDSHEDEKKDPEADFIPYDGYDDGFRETVDEPSKPFPTIFISYGTEDTPDPPVFKVTSTLLPNSRLTSWITPTRMFHAVMSNGSHPSGGQYRERMTIERTQKIIEKARIVDTLNQTERQ